LTGGKKNKEGYVTCNVEQKFSQKSRKDREIAKEKNVAPNPSCPPPRVLGREVLVTRAHREGGTLRDLQTRGRKKSKHPGKREAGLP